MKKAIVIGSGFSGLSAACYLAKDGYSVTLFEKNSSTGGRARQYIRDGFTFDLGPTWYWMPDIFESFFADFNKKPSDYYNLSRLDPGYQVYTGKADSVKIESDLNKVLNLFEREEPGSSKFLRKFLKDAEFNYKTAIDKVIYKPGKSPLELVSTETVTRLSQFTSSISKKIRKNIKSEKLAQILEFPVLFLGAKPESTPAFYCFMNYADLVLGTWYVEGGMYSVVKGIESLSKELGITIHTNATIERIEIKDKKASGVYANGKYHEADLIISSADYQHSESLIPKEYRNFSEKYWSNRTFAPSALLYYVGFNKKIKNVSHHTLFFDTDFREHARNIYDTPNWPEKPLFYGSFSSITDPGVAPIGKEAATFLIPIAPGIFDDIKVREKYFHQIIERVEYLTGQKLKDSIEFYHTYGVQDFIDDYNAYKGNAYGLANILSQTGFLRPGIENKKIKNLFYTGQLTVPGPGVPPALISGKIAATLAKTKLR